MEKKTLDVPIEWKTQLDFNQKVLKSKDPRQDARPQGGHGPGLDLKRLRSGETRLLLSCFVLVVFVLLFFSLLSVLWGEGGGGKQVLLILTFRKGHVFYV